MKIKFVSFLFLCYNFVMNPIVEELAAIFAPHARLYIVGGAVRDIILGQHIYDYDIVSSLRVESLKDLGLDCKINSRDFGSAKIFFKGLEFDYTTLRKDDYKCDGHHAPCKVEFVGDIATDSLRRDFTINAIYYDILDKKFFDFHNGINDLHDNIIRAIPPADENLQQDPVRILRMLRFSLQYDAKIDSETLSCAKKYAKFINNLSHERISVEYEKIEKIAKNTQKYSNFNAKSLLNLNGIYF